MPARRRLAAALPALLLAAAPARGEERLQLRWDPSVDGALLLGGLGLLVAEGVARDAGPLACRACSPNALDERARNALVFPATATARAASGALTAALALGAGAQALLEAGAHGDAAAGIVDVAVIAQASLLALDAALLLQHATRRERPDVHFGDWRGSVPAPSAADVLSFPSGQVTLAFAVATAAGTAASLRGSRLAPWVLGVGLGLAVTVGALRLAGDAAWLTDVVAGAALGSALGAGIPWWPHRPEASGRGGVALAPAPGGLRLVY